jgi:paired amphipathic helix protein Sin3a
LQVYAQVTILFKNAPDLLDEFKQFLPDTSNGAPAPQGNLFGGLIGQMTGIPQQGAGTAGPPDAGQTAASAAASGSRDKQKQVRSEKKDRENKKDAAAAAAAASSAGSDKQKKRPLGAEKEAVKQGSSKVRF